MDLKRLFAARPKAETAEEVAAALERCRAAAIEAQSALASLESRRADTFVSGSETEIEAIERSILDTKDHVARFGALAEALEQKLEAMRRDHAIAAVVQKIEHANALAENAEKAIRTRYRELAEALRREVLEPEAAAVRALAEAAQARTNLLIQERVLELPVAIRKAPLLGLLPKAAEYRAEVLGGRVVLPSLQGFGFPVDNAPLIWPPAEFGIPIVSERAQ